MNLQPVDNQKDGDPDREDWRNRHIIRFSQIDGAGIVYYPRYFEMLADSFPQHFGTSHPAKFNISFHHPVRLGEQLLLEQTPSGSRPSESDPDTPEQLLSPAGTATTDSKITVKGMSAGELCFELQKSNLPAKLSTRWPHDAKSFVRQVEIRDWMTGVNGRMHLSRCYELKAVLMEEWFTKSLHCPFATTQSSNGVLVPTVELHTEVQELPSAGDIVQVSLVVLHIGRSSLGLGMNVRRNGQLLVQTLQTIVFVAFQNAQLGSLQIPSQLLPKLHEKLITTSN